MAKYFGRDGRPCQLVEWQRLQGDRDYRVVREYDNGEVLVRLEWVGKVADPSVYRDCWEMFRLTVGNYTATGARRSDPVMNGKTFAYEKDGIQAYEEFLVRWTESHRDSDGGFVEEDNDLAPPPPPNPDAPTSQVSAIKGMEDDGVGAW